MSSNLHLLSNIVSSGADGGIECNPCSETNGDVFNFEDFEKDLDFINDHLGEEEGKHRMVNVQPNNEVDETEDEGLRFGENVRSHPTINESFVGLNDIDGENLDTICDEKQQKKVSFDLRDCAKYSNPEDSASDTENCEIIDDTREALTRIEDDFTTSHSKDTEGEDNYVKLSDGCNVDAINNCTKCDCRLTKMHILNLPELSKLFSRTKNKNHLNKKKNEKPKIFGKKSKKVDKGEKNADDVIQLRKMPLDTGWAKSNNTSLMQWLKLKDKEAKKKKITEKKTKRDEKRAKKLEELDKLCRKEMSDKIVSKWMKEKRKQEQILRKSCKVIPFNDNNGLNHADHAPEGFTVIDSFVIKDQEGDTDEQHSKMELFEPKHLTGSGKEPRWKSKKGAKVSIKYKEVETKNEARKTYDEWLKEKGASIKANSRTQAKQQNNGDHQLFVKEKARRDRIKVSSRKKVDCNQPLHAKGTLTSSKDQNKDIVKKQGYKWVEKFSKTEVHISKEVADRIMDEDKQNGDDLNL